MIQRIFITTKTYSDGKPTIGLVMPCMEEKEVM
jgi:hypothetical protein